MIKNNLSSLLMFLICIFLTGCTNDSNPAKPISNPTPEEEKNIADKPVTLTVNLDKLRIRDKAGLDGKELAVLQKGTQLSHLGGVSDFRTKVKLRGIPYDEPWLQVQTKEGIEGWIFAGGISFGSNDSSKLSETLLDSRLKSMFGHDLTADIKQYKFDYENVRTSEDMANVFSKGMRLRDKLVTILGDKILIDDPIDNLPDLFWLEKAMPGFETALVAEGTTYYLFRNFKELQIKAASTEGTADDDFTKLCLTIHATDSIEYFFPGWMIQTWDYGGHSLLGQGKHFQILTQMDEVLKNSSLFENEILKLKNEMLTDIIGIGITYWEPQNKIIEELNKIIAADFNVLTIEDKIGLVTRNKMFEKVKANKIELNKRAGL